ncbi:hypothetical protein B0T14DRAFT_526483 [Immersiella caudata]|uniref:Uncharacterized protein n=1 Tax=Immersiella caudata TaxID=314043 RepID=A0AA39WDU2_9PEZI|nr:hypothetical protein B0T14DRAFT_526483 [Immersiella caudata]
MRTWILNLCFRLATATMSATFSNSLLGTFTLPPQTTPFLPSATAAAAACNSRSRSVLCFTTAGQLIPNYACDIVDSINPTTFQYLNPDCYPPHYDLINQLGSDDRTLAWPGTACPAGYTPGCTTTLTLTNPTAKPAPYTATLTQTWCCPAPAGINDGDWVCTDRDQLSPTSRLCLSRVAPGGTANLWFSADPAIAATARTGASAQAVFTTSAVGAQMSIRVVRAAFPLGEVQQVVVDGLAGLPVGSQGGGGQNQTGTTTASGGGGTNPGIIVGIVIGALALVGFVATGIYLCVCYKREGKKEGRKVENEVGDEGLMVVTGMDEDKKKSRENVTDFAVGELPASVRYQAPGRFTEMGSETGAAELPTEYNSGGRDPGDGSRWL